MSGAPAQEPVSIDATNRSLGRLASTVATLLRGKDQPQWRPNLVQRRTVTVVNLTKVALPAVKRKDKKFRFSGYPGGLKTTTLAERWQKDPERVLRQMISAMLPANRLRRHYLKNLLVKK